MLIRADPMFDEIYLWHCDSTNTKEYSDIDLKILKELPDPKEWNSDKKKLVIIDDIEFKNLSKNQQYCLNRLYGYVSTHKNVSVILATQNFYNIPTIVRRCSNMFILWRINDTTCLKTISKKCGISSSQFDMLFEKYIHKLHDSLWIDMTSNTPAKIRINGFQII